MKSSKRPSKSRLPRYESFLNRGIKTLFSSPFYFAVLISSITPLIVFLRPVEVPPEVQFFWINSIDYDFFSSSKALFLISATLVLAVSSLFYCFSRKITLHYFYDRFWLDPLLRLFSVCFFLVVITTILSTVFSDYTSVALKGFPDRYEGLYVWLSYFIIFSVCASYALTEKKMESAVFIIFIAGLLVGMVGLLQFFGFNPLFFRPFLSLVVPARLSDIIPNLSSTFSAYRSYGTLNNPNYAGSFFALLLPLSFGMYFLSRTKLHQLFFLVSSWLFYFNLLGSRSRAGWVGSFFALLILMVFLRDVIWTKKKSFLLLMCVFMVTAYGMNHISGDLLVQRVTIDGLALSDEPPSHITEILHEDSEIAVSWTDRRLHLLFDDGGFVKAYDESLSAVSHSSTFDTENNVILYEMNDVPFSNFIIEYHPEHRFIMIEERERWGLNFIHTESGIKALWLDKFLIDIESPDRFGFEGREKLGSSRGYIYSRSIPLLKDTLILGNGPDTYPMYFPQNDYAGKLAFLYNPYMIVDKPHNLYLQIGINQGVLSLLSFLGMVLLYFLATARGVVFHRATSHPMTKYALLLVCSIIGYLIAGVFNDSVVTVAPVFWALWGIGVSVSFSLIRQA